MNSSKQNILKEKWYNHWKYSHRRISWLHSFMLCVWQVVSLELAYLTLSSLNQYLVNTNTIRFCWRLSSKTYYIYRSTKTRLSQNTLNARHNAKHHTNITWPTTYEWWNHTNATIQIHLTLDTQCIGYKNLRLYTFSIYSWWNIEGLLLVVWICASFW